MGQSDPTTIQVSRQTRELLGDIRPYESMSFDELVQEMAQRSEFTKGEN
jgi:hypothetical protein